MRTYLLGAMWVCMAFGQTQTTKPDPKTEAPKQATVDVLQLENIELKAALNKRHEQDLNEAFIKLVAATCATIGGKTADDCVSLPRKQGEPMVLQLKTPAPAPAKPEAK